jgi:biopolymer transport protein ExbD
MSFGGPSKGVKNEINVTPLVDVVLVLLIIFMVVTPMLQRGKDVSLPTAGPAPEQKEEDPLVLSVTNDHKTWFESNEAAGAALEAKVGEVLRREPGRKILLKGDERLTVGDVRKVMAQIRSAGAQRVALAVQEKK